jgi:hypothetical protein
MSLVRVDIGHQNKENATFLIAYAHYCESFVPRISWGTIYDRSQLLSYLIEVNVISIAGKFVSKPSHCVLSLPPEFKPSQ